MKNKFTILLFVLASLSAVAQWKPQGDKIKTKWAEEVDPNHTLPDYPRPIMERNKWKNLNGLWNYSIQPAGKEAPVNYDGKILVPFAVESSLSGVMKTVGAEKELWYETSFTIDSDWKNKDILLHFGAVDWKTEVWINDIKIGIHTGGYTPFSFNITPFLNGKSQKLVVKVWDPSSEGTQPRGKQVKNPESIWYTPVTGIWQTVWLEPVAKKHINNIRTTPDIDHNTISILSNIEGASAGDIIEISVFDGAKTIASAKAVAGQAVDIVLANPKLWSPDSPFIYDTKIKLISNGKVADEVKSYFAMRKISSKRDADGIVRMQLNNKDVFQFGPLDQGWWPDGLYTAPTDEALKYDLVKTKELGFNMIRKHVKVEPARWYTYCDRMGFLVWQDMPSGDEGPIWQMHKYFEGNELKRTAQSEATYRKEWKEIMDELYSYPSIVVWVPFNEAWGQFKTVEITEWTKNYDPSRLVNSSSGGNHFQTGDILDIHHYPGPDLKLYDARRVTVLGEYGGIGLPVEGHLWQTDKNWGYTQFKNTGETTAKYKEYADQLIKMAKVGFSAAVYTQTTDVEGEVNGFMTYDRKVDKMIFSEVNKINKEVINAINK
ncbi:glycoside hydrolase family 2 protein [Flavobacterium aestuarii]|uniref:glycoside hydrolase family 2 protein n=1 Tax=Flavobacterium aestuarii TaxID=3149227 RepID=UPI0032B41EFE